jgi:hypothetical protein
MSERKFNEKRSKKNFANDKPQETRQEEKSTKMPLINCKMQAKNDKTNTGATEGTQVGEWTEVKLQPASQWRMFHRLNEPSLEDLRATLADEFPGLSISGVSTGLKEGCVIRSQKLNGGMHKALFTPNKKRKQVQPPGQQPKKSKIAEEDGACGGRFCFQGSVLHRHP